LGVTAVDDQMPFHQGAQPSSKLYSTRPSGDAVSTASGKQNDSTNDGGGNLSHKRCCSGASTMSGSEPQAPGEEDLSGPPSTAGSMGDGRFTLGGLFSEPKRSRRGSASSKKSANSKKSESESCRKAGCTAGESDFSTKYGVCCKPAIGKGATSVVRLAHKWDRAEEKVYAVKVLSPFCRACPTTDALFSRSSENAERTRRRRCTSRSLLLSFAFRPPSTIPMSSRRSISCKMSTILGAKSWSFVQVGICTRPFEKAA